jgi:hypothetical protein
VCQPPTAKISIRARPGAEPKTTCRLAALCWSAAAILLGFFCFAHLGAMLCFLAGRPVSPLVAPTALAASLAAGDWLLRREGIRGLPRRAPPGAALGILGISLLLSAAFLDMSWDGLWYHQSAVYQMAHGWNPLRDPMHTFVPSIRESLRHYATGPWFVALAIFQTAPHIEWAKPAPWMAMAAMFLSVFAAGLDWGMGRRTAAGIAALVSLNPVVVFELATYLVDGLLVSFLACYVAALAGTFRRPRPVVHAVALASTLLCVNTKSSGLVYLCFFCAAGALYLLVRQRRMPWRFAGLQLALILLAAGVFGYNPYVTNTIHRHHPFYPWMGTAAYPGYTQPGRDPRGALRNPREHGGPQPVPSFLRRPVRPPRGATLLPGGTPRASCCLSTSAGRTSRCITSTTCAYPASARCSAAHSSSRWR